MNSEHYKCKEDNRFDESGLYVWASGFQINQCKATVEFRICFVKQYPLTRIPPPPNENNSIYFIKIFFHIYKTTLKICFPYLPLFQQ